MDAQLLLAEAAAPHADGTISMVRAGITQLRGAGPPISLHACLVARIEADPGDEGWHDYDLRGMDADGAPVFPTLRGGFPVGRGGGFTTVLMNLQTTFPRLGTHAIVLRVDHAVVARLTLEVASPEEPS